MFSCAGFLVGRAVAVFGMVVLASSPRVVGRLLLAPGCVVGFWFVA